MFIEIIVLILITLLGCKIYSRITMGFCKSKRRIDGKVVIVTGANCGIGFETAKDLAKRGGKIILACRDMNKARNACHLIKNEFSGAKVYAMELDVSSMESVRKFCKNFQAQETRLDILINNAGMVEYAYNEPTITSEGNELMMATNYLGHFLLTNILLEQMIKTGGGRIVNVSSTGHLYSGNLDLENLNSEKIWNKWRVYSITKLCNILFTKELDRKLRVMDLSPGKISTYSLHPGVVKSNLFIREGICHLIPILMLIKFLNWFTLMKTCYEGSQTSLYCAISEDLDGQSGGYYFDCKKTQASKLAQDSKLAQNLWEKTKMLVNLKSSEYHLNSEINFKES